MTTAFKVFFWLFAALYGAALFLFAIGTFGWFGQERDPLSGVFLLPLGLPWNLMLDSVASGGRGILAALAPGLNLSILGCLVLLMKRK